MTLSVDLALIDGIVIATVTGEYRRDAAVKALGNTFGFLAENHSKKLLIDAREMENPPRQIMETAGYALAAIEGRKASHAADVKTAYLFAAEQENESQHLAETMADNRGVIARVFYDYDEAVAWLKNGADA